MKIARRNEGGGALSSPVPTVAANRRRGTVSLLFILVSGCLLVVGVFATLIAVSVTRMQSTTDDLIAQRIASDVSYSRSVQQSILSPIEAGEKLAKAHRLRYIGRSQQLRLQQQQGTAGGGRDLCSEDSNLWEDSAEFLVDAMSTVLANNPVVGWVYTNALSNKYVHPITGDHQTYECGISPEYIYTRTRGSFRTSDRPLTREDLSTNLSSVPSTVDDITDYRYDEYVGTSLSYTQFAWLPFLYVDPMSGSTDLFLCSYSPIAANRTNPIDGTVTSFTIGDDDVDNVDDISSSFSPQDPSLTVTSMFGLDIRVAHIAALITAMTPTVGGGGGGVGGGGAHTSLYDMHQGCLIATSEPIVLYDETSYNMWPAGETPSAALNEAYRAAAPLTGAQELALRNATNAVYVTNSNGRVLSVIHITTRTHLDFVIIQSTPTSYYSGNAAELQTIMIVMGVVAAIVIVAACVAIVVAIRRNITKIREGMVLAAVLKNDQVVPCSSLITELNNLCTAFATMNAKLGAARAFMPQSMLVSSSSSSSSDDDDDESGEDHGTDRSDDETNNNDDADAVESGMARVDMRCAEDGTANTSRMVFTRVNNKHRGVGGGGGRQMRGANKLSNSQRNNVSSSTNEGILPVSGSEGNTTNTTRTSGGLGLNNNKSNNSANVSSSFLATSSSLSPAAALAVSAMQLKRVTVLVINGRGFHKQCGGGGGLGGAMTAKTSLSYSASKSSTLLEVQSATFAVKCSAHLTSTIATLSAQHRGVIDAFHGDHFVVTFNAAKSNAQGPQQATQCAMALVERYEHAFGKRERKQMRHHQRRGMMMAVGDDGGNTPANSHHQSSSNPPFMLLPRFFSMGLASGRAIVGHLGSSEMKRFSVVGKVYSKAVLLERICRQEQQFQHCCYYPLREEGGASSSPLSSHAPLSASFSSSHASQPPPIQVVTDAHLASDIEHSHYLQVVGRLLAVEEERVRRAPPSSSPWGARNDNVPDFSPSPNSRCAVLYAIRGPIRRTRGHYTINARTSGKKKKNRGGGGGDGDGGGNGAPATTSSKLPRQQRAQKGRHHQGVDALLSSSSSSSSDDEEGDLSPGGDDGDEDDATGDEWLYELQPYANNHQSAAVSGGTSTTTTMMGEKVAASSSSSSFDALLPIVNRAMLSLLERLGQPGETTPTATAASPPLSFVEFASEIPKIDRDAVLEGLAPYYHHNHHHHTCMLGERGAPPPHSSSPSSRPEEEGVQVIDEPYHNHHDHHPHGNKGSPVKKSEGQQQQQQQKEALAAHCRRHDHTRQWGWLALSRAMAVARGERRLRVTHVWEV